MRLASGSATVVCLLLVAVASAQAAPPDLTGAYTGKSKCVGFADGQPVSFKSELTVTLDHAPDNLIRGVFEMINDVRSIALDACGFVISDAAKPDQARAAIGAGTAPNEAFFTVDLSKVTVFAANRAGKSGKLKATLVLAIRSSDTMLTCKLTADRTSTADPNLAACPPP